LFLKHYSSLAKWKPEQEHTMDFKLTHDFARQLDAHDDLAGYRANFFNNDPEMLYLDGNSLGRLPAETIEKVQEVVIRQWGEKLIQGWNNNWWDAPARVGNKIGSLVGAADGQVIVCDTVSVNLFKLATAALQARPIRPKIVTDKLNFPSDLYVLQGVRHLLGDRHEILMIGSNDSEITPDLGALYTAIDANTALVTLSHVVFKSGYLYDMAAITEYAHRKGALVLWDLSHSAGSVPVELDACGADFAIGCTYKYLNGGPGAPAFLYVNEHIQEQVSSPIWAWWGQKDPFAFSLDYTPASGATRFLTGTQPMISLLAMEASLEPLLGAGMKRIRDKSVMMTEYMIYLADAVLEPLGFSLGTPREADQRGSHVSLRPAEGYRINRALIDEMKVIPDFREPDNIRFGLAPLYTSFEEIWEAVERIKQMMLEKSYEKYPVERLAVT
jgi:kynureninase